MKKLTDILTEAKGLMLDDEYDYLFIDTENGSIRGGMMDELDEVEPKIAKELKKLKFGQTYVKDDFIYLLMV